MATYLLLRKKSASGQILALFECFFDFEHCVLLSTLSLAETTVPPTIQSAHSKLRQSVV